MKNLFDSYINSVLNQLNEQDTSLTPNVVNSFKDVLHPIALNQEVDAKDNPNVNKDRLNAAVAAGVIERKPDGTHAVTDAAISHISPEDPDIGGKFVPAQQASTTATATNQTTPASNNQTQTSQSQNNTQTSTNNAGVVSSVYSPNKK